jgi:anti-sigma regulatory factor (Ser/Thr protein kinase)
MDQFRTARNLDAGALARARVVAEELISNTIKYGYRGECDRPIRLRLSAGPVLTMVYDDAAEPFDPTQWRPKPEWTILNPERPAGLRGIDLVLGLSSAVDYRALPDGNRLVITFAAKATPPSTDAGAQTR